MNGRYQSINKQLYLVVDSNQYNYIVKQLDNSQAYKARSRFFTIENGKISAYKLNRAGGIDKFAAPAILLKESEQ